MSDYQENTGDIIQTVDNTSSSDLTLSKQENVSFPELTWLRSSSTIITGFLFGAALQKAQFGSPAVISDQFYGATNWSMMKFFLSAEVTGFISLIILSLKFSSHFTEVRKKCFKCDQGWPSSLIGGFILGVSGLLVAGSCPGNVYVQLGALTAGAWQILLGAFTGAIVYGFLAPKLEPFLKWKVTESHTVDTYLNVPYHKLAIPGTLAMIICVAIIEIVVPWRSNLVHDPTPSANASVFAYAWIPIIAGLIAGALQFPSSYIIHKAVGASSSYITIISHLLSAFVSEETFKSDSWTYWRKAHGWTPDKWWQVFQVLGIFFGSLVMSAADQSLGIFTAFNFYRSFFGGFFMILGARLAGGCPSGHGLSGFIMLRWNSIAALCGMMGGGFLVGIPAYFIAQA